MIRLHEPRPEPLGAPPHDPPEGEGEGWPRPAVVVIFVAGSLAFWILCFVLLAGVP